MTKRLCGTSHETLGYDWLKRGMWGNLFFFSEEPQSVWLSVYTCVIVYVFICVCACERKIDGRGRDVTCPDKWVTTSQGGTDITNGPNFMWHAMIWVHLQGVDSTWSQAGRSTVRGACQLANSPHQRNYVHKHSRVPFDLALTPIGAF